MGNSVIRSAIKPKVPVRKSSAARDVATASVKLHKCANKACGTYFQKMRIDQKVCGWECSAVVGIEQTLKAVRRNDAARRESIKTRSQVMKEAQVSFNNFIRARDRIAGYNCISSNRVLDWSGNAVDSGHYRSIGAAQHLRFNENNCHAQSKHDNLFLSGNAVHYRAGLIKRIGLAKVEALESDQSSPKWTIEDLRAIKALYRRKLKDLKNDN